MPQSADTHIRSIVQGVSAFVPLDLEQRTHVDTASAAYHLGRKAQTMRVWASTEKGPIRPVRINGRLSWPVAEIRRLLRAA
jgi:hypothetical protein